MRTVKLTRRLGAIIEAAMRENPEVRRRIAEHRALREAMQGAFSAVLDEPVPQRLIDAARGQTAAPAGGHVVDLARRSKGCGGSGTRALAKLATGCHGRECVGGCCAGLCRLA